MRYRQAAGYNVVARRIDQATAVLVAIAPAIRDVAFPNDNYVARSTGPHHQFLQMATILGNQRANQLRSLDECGRAIEVRGDKHIAAMIFHSEIVNIQIAGCVSSPRDIPLFVTPMQDPDGQCFPESPQLILRVPPKDLIVRTGPQAHAANERPLED